MPLAFPSHQGLIAPLWRRWPERFDAIALGVGAAAPDVVDGCIGLFRGHLGQSWGHSLLGLACLCLPAGLVLDRAIKAWVRRVRGRQPARLQALAPWTHPRLATGVLCVLIGAFSHLVFDFVSHGNFLWLYPWYEDPTFFPGWWYARWFEIRVPLYREPYPVGPHLLMWLALSILGAVMFVSGGAARAMAGKAGGVGADSPRGESGVR